MVWRRPLRPAAWPHERVLVVRPLRTADLDALRRALRQTLRERPGEDPGAEKSLDELFEATRTPNRHGSASSDEYRNVDS